MCNGASGIRKTLSEMRQIGRPSMAWVIKNIVLFLVEEGVLKVNKSQIIELYEYNNWANEKLLEAVSHLENEEFARDLLSSFRSIRDTMVHVLGVEELWLSRWMGEQGHTLLRPDDFPTSTYLASQWDNFRDQINGFLSSLTEENLTEKISFKNIKGITYSLELWKQLLHGVLYTYRPKVQ